VADVGATYGPRIAEWPHGLKHGLNPGLMTGFTGIALCFLRVAAEDPISVLRP
jgi:lantibiotic modifying enzyme